jgi:protein AbiQ
MGNTMDFLRIEDKLKSSLYAVLNLNNMIPVPTQCISRLRYNEIQNYRSFKNEKERLDYIYLLQNEKLIIDGMADTINIESRVVIKRSIIS